MKQVPIILFQGNEEHWVYDGTLDEAIAVVKIDRGYRNYSRTGAHIYMGELRYEINEAGIERRHVESTEYGYA